MFNSTSICGVTAMGKEHEIMICGVDRDGVIGKLKEIGAEFRGKFEFKRVEFMVDGEPGAGHSWIRIRTDGTKTTLALKHFYSDNEAMDEYEVKTNDFKETVKIMSKLANSEILYFETSREAYALGDVQITIDKWPEIPHFVEIEAPSNERLQKARAEIAISGKFAGNAAINEVYRMYGLDFADTVRKNSSKMAELLKEEEK